MKKYIPPMRFHFLTSIYDFACSIIGLGQNFKKELLTKTAITDKTTILDLGCGTGVLTVEAKLMFPNSKVIGIDPDRAAISIAQKRAASLDVSFILSGAERLPLKDKSADYVISSLAFHHMPLEIKKKAIKEIKRVMKPKGAFYLFDFKPRKKTLFNFFTFIEAEYARDNYEGKLHAILEENGFSTNQLMTKYGLFELLEIERK